MATHDTNSLTNVFAPLPGTKDSNKAYFIKHFALDLIAVSDPARNHMISALPQLSLCYTQNLGVKLPPPFIIEIMVCVLRCLCCIDFEVVLVVALQINTFRKFS